MPAKIPLKAPAKKKTPAKKTAAKKGAAAKTPAKKKAGGRVKLIKPRGTPAPTSGTDGGEESFVLFNEDAQVVLRGPSVSLSYGLGDRPSTPKERNDFEEANFISSVTRKVIDGADATVIQFADLDAARKFFEANYQNENDDDRFGIRVTDHEDTLFASFETSAS